VGTSDFAARYEIVRTIARGGMADIIEAIDLDGRTVAIKLLREGLTDDPDIVARFHREARLAASLESRHVARIFDFGENDRGQPFIAMELLSGNDLAQEIRQRGALPLEEAASYVAQTCHAMIEAHDAGIVHRDLKPPNLFLAEEGDTKRVLKVLDFGISKATKGPGDGHVTLTRTLFGSPLYMSPETFQSTKAADVRSDVWSLGVIFYEMITGVPPFDAENAWTIGIAVTRHQQVPPTERRAYLPRSADVVVGRALKKDPNERYQSMRELLAAIEVFLPHGRNETMMLKQVEAPDTAEDDPRTAQMRPVDAARLIEQLLDVEPPADSHRAPRQDHAERTDHSGIASPPSVDHETFDGPTHDRTGHDRQMDTSARLRALMPSIRDSLSDPPTLVELPRQEPLAREPARAPALSDTDEAPTRVEHSDVVDPPTWVRPDASVASVHAALSKSVKRAREASDPDASKVADTDRAVNLSTIPPAPIPTKSRRLALWLTPLALIALGVSGWFLLRAPAVSPNKSTQPIAIQAVTREAAVTSLETASPAIAEVSATPSASAEVAPPALPDSAAVPPDEDSAVPSPSAQPALPKNPGRRKKPKYFPKGI
jgi:serine/threonine protein kinase